MKFALVNGKKTFATKGAIGSCPSCGSELIAKCGEIKVNHWSHKGNRNCDPWWENETEWHRAWKEHFPGNWQEIVRKDQNGEKHIADIKTDSDYVIEFQHSYLNPEERRSRNTFYPKLVWVVNGLRRKTDKSQFCKLLEQSRLVFEKPQILQVNFLEEFRLIKEWNGSNSLVFFDFNNTNMLENSVLWFLFPKVSNGIAYLSHFSKSEFIKCHLEGSFDELVNNIILPIRETLLAYHEENKRLNRRHELNLTYYKLNKQKRIDRQGRRSNFYRRRKKRRF